MLLHLPNGHAAEHGHDALLATIATLPAHLARSLTWDQGVEMGRHAEFAIASGIPVFFCDPASPWQRGSNENTSRASPDARRHVAAGRVGGGAPVGGI
jgi:transposase, IS30 family